MSEFRILAALMGAGGRVLRRDQLVASIRGSSHQDVSDRSADVHIVALRRKLGAAAGHIKTIRGVGYAFRM